MAQTRRVTVSLEADDHEVLRDLALRVRRPAGRVARELAELYGDDYADRRLRADKAAEDAADQTMRGAA